MIRAVLALGVLTMVMSAWMSIARLIAMNRANIDLQSAAHTADLQSLLPSGARRVADNFNHLFQVPTVFYATTLAVVAAGIADWPFAWCAWLFVCLRVLHSIVQATFNRVAIRAMLYGLSWIPLAVTIVRAVVLL